MPSDTSSSENENVPTMPLQKLKEAVDMTLEKYLSSMRFQSFADCYGPIATKHPQQLRRIFDTTKKQIREHLQEEVKLIFQEEDIEELLKQLHNLVEMQSNKKGTTAWRPSGNPRVDLADHYCDIKQKHMASLQKQLRDQEARNEVLQERVISGREVVQDLYAKTQTNSQKFDQVMMAFEKQSLATLAHKLDSIQ